MAALRPERGEESPGSTEVRCRVTPGGGDPRDSATENTPPPVPACRTAARVKWCGKGAPRRRQRRWQGKPHREQDQVGAAGTGEQFLGCRADLRAAARVGRTRRSATGVREEWPSPPATATRWAGQNPAYAPSGFSGPLKQACLNRDRIRRQAVTVAAVYGLLYEETYQHSKKYGFGCSFPKKISERSRARINFI